MSIFYTPPCDRDKKFAFPKVFSNFLKFNGCWPTDGDADNIWFQCKNIMYRIWGWLFFMNMVFLLSSELGFFFVNMKNVPTAVENLSTTVIGAMMLFRTMHMLCSLDDLKQILTVFADKIWINRKQHPHIVKRCERNMRPIFIHSLIYWFTLVLYFFQPIVIFFTSHQTMESTDKVLPYHMLFPYDAQKAWYYFGTYLASVIAGYTTVSQFYALDALMTMLVSYLCGQFELLHGEIARLIPECHAEWLSQNGDGVVEDSDARSLRLLQDMYTKRLHKLSSKHSDLISFSLQLNDIFSFPLWVYIINSTFLICFCAFQFIVGGTSSYADFLRTFLYFMSVNVQLYLICATGTMLINSSTDTACYLYMCNWEGGQISEHSPLLLQPVDMESTTLSVKLPLWQSINYYPTDKDFQQKLRFMIMRSQRSMQLSALKFTILSLESFSKIISTSLSYFTLLNTFMDKQN